VKKTLLVAFAVTVLFVAGSGVSTAQSWLSVGDAGKGVTTSGGNQQELMTDFEEVEQNVSEMLKLLEDLENDEGLSEQPKGAGEELDTLGQANPMDPFIKSDESGSLTQSSRRKNKTKNNIEAADEVVKFVPGDSDSHFRLGLDSWRSQKPDEAIQHFKEVLRLEPENAHAYWNLGLLYEEKNEVVQAVEYIKKAEDIYLKYGYSKYAKQARMRIEKLAGKDKDPLMKSLLSN